MTADKTYALREAITWLTGIVLTEDKEYLLASRLNKLMEDYNLPDYDSVAAKIKSGPDEKFNNLIIDAITTGETSFFRDEVYFDAITKEFLPEYSKKNRREQIRIWSVGCSTGQEPYSIVMAIYKNFPELVGQFEIYATDVSASALARAQGGLYSPLEMKRGVTPSDRTKFFKLKGENFYFRDDFRSSLRFARLNLFDSLPDGNFDVIFCRNVGIYFSECNRRKIFQRLFECILPNGILVVGASESVLSFLPSAQIIEYGRARFYKKN